MPKVGFVSTMDAVPWGGSEELWRRTAERLCKQGVQTAAHVKWWPEVHPALRSLQEAGVAVTRQRAPRRFVRILQKSATTGWLNRVAPDLVVLSLGFHLAGVHWMNACLARGIPYAIVVQAAGEHWWPGDSDAARLARGYEGAAGVFVLSDRNLETIRNQTAAPIRHAQRIFNPFAVSYDAGPEWPGGSEFRLASVARLEPGHKGQDILFDVLRMRKWRERPVSVSLFGVGPSESTLKRLAEMRGLNNVCFAGHVSDVESIWATHHALVMPSRFEGLPLALVEAMLCGRPSIVTDVAGNAELVEDNVSGFVAAGTNDLAFDEALERAWQRRHAWRDIGLAAAKRVREIVPPDPPGAFAKQLLDLMEVGGGGQAFTGVSSLQETIL
jgi:glycosyltransferase involved in cell wall biosynthesis